MGCTIETLVRTANSGRAHEVLKIGNNVGARVLIVDPDFKEYLSPSTVGYYQRRLGIKTSFAAAPEQTKTDDLKAF